LTDAPPLEIILVVKMKVIFTKENGELMSLDVAPELLTQAAQGEIDDDAFVATVRRSLPYAYALIDRISAEAHAGDAPFADNQVPPPSEAERGQLLRALASDAIRGSLERHFGVRLAFQNCHRVAAFRLDADPAVHAGFTSTRSQVLNQSPELRNC
jgi:hypothetical protein